MPEPGARRLAARRSSSAAGFTKAVRGVIESLPPGEILTYGEVAREAGYEGAARAVGTLLARDGEDLPWWRVVTSTGRLVPGHEAEHARRLRAEGVGLGGEPPRVLRMHNRGRRRDRAGAQDFRGCAGSPRSRST